LKPGSPSGRATESSLSRWSPARVPPGSARRPSRGHPARSRADAAFPGAVSLKQGCGDGSAVGLRSYPRLSPGIG